jgi:hypothetical protein
MAKVTKEHQEAFEAWKKALTLANKGAAFPWDKMHLIHCPFSLRLEQLGKKAEIHPFTYWGESCVASFGNARYMRMGRAKRGDGTQEKALPLVRSYSAGNVPCKKAEENTLTIFFEKPSEAVICPPKGAIAEARGLAKYPVSLGEEMVEYMRLRPTATHQHILTPLGRKGLVAFHTGHQYCPVENLPRGKFQRFFLGPDVKSTCVRIAHTLRKLAEADPKTTQNGIEAIQKRLAAALKTTAHTVLYWLEPVLHYDQEENLIQQAKTFQRGLGCRVVLGPEIFMNLCPDRVWGARPDTFALSLEVGCTPEKYEGAIKTCWKGLSK